MNYYKTENSVISVSGLHVDRMVAAGRDLITYVVDHYAVGDLEEITPDEAFEFIKAKYAEGVRKLCGAYITPLKITLVENIEFLVYGHLSIVYEPLENVTRIGYVSNHFVEDDILHIAFVDIINCLKYEYHINHEVTTTPVLMIHAPLSSMRDPDILTHIGDLDTIVNVPSSEYLVTCNDKAEKTLGLSDAAGVVRSLFTGEVLDIDDSNITTVLPHKFITEITEAYVTSIHKLSASRLAGKRLEASDLHDNDYVDTFAMFTGNIKPIRTDDFNTSIRSEIYLGRITKVDLSHAVPKITISDPLIDVDVEISMTPDNLVFI